MEAAIILAKCKNRNYTYGIRIQKMDDGDWWRTWAFPIDEQRGNREGYGITRIQGNMFYKEGYPGCPYCKTMDFVQCGKCSKLTCFKGENSMICSWCGNSMNNITPASDKFNVSGGDI